MNTFKHISVFHYESLTSMTQMDYTLSTIYDIVLTNGKALQQNVKDKITVSHLSKMGYSLS